MNSYWDPISLKQVKDIKLIYNTFVCEVSRKNHTKNENFPVL